VVEAAEVFEAGTKTAFDAAKAALVTTLRNIEAVERVLACFPTAAAAVAAFRREVDFNADFEFFEVKKQIAALLLTTRIAGLTMMSFNFIGTSELDIAVLVSGTVSLHNYGPVAIPVLSKVYAVPTVSPAISGQSRDCLQSHSMRSAEGALLVCPMMVTVPEETINNLLTGMPEAWRTEAKKRAFLGMCVSRESAGSQEIMDLSIGINGP
jgi:hypothetical protein